MGEKILLPIVHKYDTCIYIIHYTHPSSVSCKKYVLFKQIIFFSNKFVLLYFFYGRKVMESLEQNQRFKTSISLEFDVVNH